MPGEYPHPYVNSDETPNVDAYENGHAHPYRNTEAYKDGYKNANRHRDAHGLSYTYRYSFGYTDALTDLDSDRHSNADPVRQVAVRDSLGARVRRILAKMGLMDGV